MSGHTDMDMEYGARDSARRTGRFRRRSSLRRTNVFHSYETPELLMAQKSATCKIGPSDLVPLEKTPSALRDGLQSPPVSSPSVLARAPAWAIG
jgi:hypothetical protein